jgi:hypothetical protein
VGVLLLVTACGGKSVSKSGEDPGNGAGSDGTPHGGTGGGGASHGGTSSQPPASASGGASSASGGASSGGASMGSGGGRAGSAGLAGNAGGPSVSMLDDLCDEICTSDADTRCAGQLSDCATSCYTLVAVGDNTAACARATYDYLVCVSSLPSICDLGAEDLCSDSSSQVFDCVVAYCQATPSSPECRAIGGSE